MHHNLHFVDQADGVSLTGSLPFEELAIIYAKQMRRTTSSHAEIVTGPLQQAMSRLLDLPVEGLYAAPLQLYIAGEVYL
jgi:hypothetical protein